MKLLCENRLTQRWRKLDPKHSLRNLKDEMVFIRQDSELDSRGTRTFNLRTVIGNPVVDHIGDYTERAEEPGFDALF